MFRKLLSMLLLILLLAVPALADGTEGECLESGISISISKETVYAYRRTSVTCTIEYGPDVYEPIQLFDHTLRLLAEVENDGSGLAEVALQLRPQPAP